MRDDLPSVTAMIVALARGLSGAGQGRSRDPFARELLPQPLRGSLDLARRASDRRPRVERALSFATFDMLAHASLRTGEIDAAVEAAVRSGVHQVVIVGAGLDARAYRLPALADATVYEIDHPATQGLKRRRTRDLRPLPERLVHVAVDFAHDSLDDALARAGHDPHRPTLFLWEGVTMYLPRPAVRATLDVLRERGAPGSVIIVSYCETRFATIPRALEPGVKQLFALVGEPLLGLVDRAAMHGLLGEFGYRVERDTWSRDWQTATSYGERPRTRLHERVAVARRP